MSDPRTMENVAGNCDGWHGNGGHVHATEKCAVCSCGIPLQVLNVCSLSSHFEFLVRNVFVSRK